MPGTVDLTVKRIWALFESALRQREQAVHGPQKRQKQISVADRVVDLGPFEAVLPPRLPRKPPPSEEDMEDLGPFNAVLSKMPVAPNSEEDLGPFEAVLPPAKGSYTPLPQHGARSDLSGANNASKVDSKLDFVDLGPFTAAVRGFTEKSKEALTTCTMVKK